MTMDERVQHEPEQRGEPSLRDPASVVQFGELSGEEELRGCGTAGTSSRAGAGR
jgi:hypothetical protein